MRDYHLAWLSAHPDRTKEWLSERLADGFDVHHIDGNHFNNAHDNLVLIEHLDHLRVVHGVGGNRRLMKIGAASGPRRETLKKGKIAYERALAGARWAELHVHAYSHARTYASHAGREWPLKRACG